MQPENRQWFGAQASLKFFMVKFLNLSWFKHYDDWYKIVLEEKRSNVEAPRGHGKSVFWSFAVPLWDVIRGPVPGPDPEDILVSYSEDQVRRLIRNIKLEVESNELLAPIRPSSKQIWGTDMLEFPNGFFISGLGFGTSSRGKHPRRIVVDDPLKDIGGMSQEDQERAYFGVITGMAMAETQIHNIGTPVEFGDLLEKLETNPVYKQWKQPALNEKNEPLCPELFTAETLEMRRKEMGSLNFAREFLLQRIDPTTQPFKRDYETLYDAAPPRERFMVVSTVCDPAYTESDGDYTAIVTNGITHGNHGYVLRRDRIRRDDPGVIVDKLFEHIAAYTPDNVGIKRRKGDAISFTFNERRVRENRWDFRYVELKDTKAKSDRSRIGGLVPRWEAKTIHLHRMMKDFLDEIYAFRFDDSHKNDDMLDALADTYHPDMVQPNAGKRGKPMAEGKVMYRVGRASSTAPQKSDALWQRLDRRVYDEVSA